MISLEINQNPMISIEIQCIQREREKRRGERRGKRGKGRGDATGRGEKGKGERDKPRNVNSKCF